MHGLLSDPVGLGELRGVRAEVLEEGRADGSGLLRRLTIGRHIELVERFLAPDARQLVFRYRIESSRPTFSHEHGEIVCRPRGQGSRISWTTTAALPAGRLTPLTEVVGRVGTAVAFHVALTRIDRHLLRTEP
ncbi:hypothetical protein ASD11_09625 [Aeromicrobium sp. Root495]|nr:hypothetical protein ASD11_09625 [Aeromicrobium sp. Root495]